MELIRPATDALRAANEATALALPLNQAVDAGSAAPVAPPAASPRFEATGSAWRRWRPRQRSGSTTPELKAKIWFILHYFTMYFTFWYVHVFHYLLEFHYFGVCGHSPCLQLPPVFWLCTSCCCFLCFPGIRRPWAPRRGRHLRIAALKEAARQRRLNVLEQRCTQKWAVVRVDRFVYGLIYNTLQRVVYSCTCETGH